jgi:hypothetical protein
MKFAQAYAPQNEHDYTQLIEAILDGEIDNAPGWVTQAPSVAPTTTQRRRTRVALTRQWTIDAARTQRHARTTATSATGRRAGSAFRRPAWNCVNRRREFAAAETRSRLHDDLLALVRE